MTLGYEFPEIHHIDDVLPAIKDDPAFIIAKRDWGYVINYVMAGNDTFPGVHTAGGSAKMRAEQTHLKALRRECRGILFYPDGTLMSRRYHKFFNLGERDDVTEIDVSKPHVILDKLDGSMITPVYVGDDVRWGTKMGLTEIGMQAEVFVSSRPNYTEFAKWCRVSGITPIFEWVSRQQRIVIDYPEDNLILTGMRLNTDGRYLRYQTMVTAADMFDIPVVKAWEGEYSEDLFNKVRAAEVIEGIIIRFDDGHMVKVKAEVYVSLHRAKSLLDNERDVIGLVLDDKIDDLLPLLPEQDRTRLILFADRIRAAIIVVADEIHEIVAQNNLSRKEFALATENMDQMVRALCFACFDKKECPVDVVIDMVRKNLSSRARLERVRCILGSARWKEVQE